MVIKNEIMEFFDCAEIESHRSKHGDYNITSVYIKMQDDVKIAV